MARLWNKVPLDNVVKVTRHADCRHGFWRRPLPGSAYAACFHNVLDQFQGTPGRAGEAQDFHKLGGGGVPKADVEPPERPFDHSFAGAVEQPERTPQIEGRPLGRAGGGLRVCVDAWCSWASLRTNRFASYRPRLRSSSFTLCRVWVFFASFRLQCRVAHRSARALRRSCHWRRGPIPLWFPSGRRRHCFWERCRFFFVVRCWSSRAEPWSSPA